MTGPLLHVLVAALAQLLILAAVSRPPGARILAAAWVRVLLCAVRHCGITRDDEARKAVHDAIDGASRGVATGRYRADPSADREASLHAYLRGAAYRTASRCASERITRRRRYVSLEVGERQRAARATQRRLDALRAERRAARPARAALPRRG